MDAVSAVPERHRVKGHEEPRPVGGHVELSRAEAPSRESGSTGVIPSTPGPTHRVDAPASPPICAMQRVQLGRGEVAHALAW